MSVSIRVLKPARALAMRAREASYVTGAIVPMDGGSNPVIGYAP